MIKRKPLFHKKIGWLIFLLVNLCYSQQINLEEGINLINIGEFEKGNNQLNKIDVSTLKVEQKALQYFYLGYSYAALDKTDLAYKNMLMAKRMYIDLNFAEDVKDCNIQILSILKHQNNLKKETITIINELYEYAKNKNDPKAFFTIYRELGSNFLLQDEPEKALMEFRKSLELAEKVKDSLQISFNYMNIGLVKGEYLNDRDSSLWYTKKALPYLISTNNKTNIAYNYNNQAEAYKALKKYDEALSFYKKANEINIEENETKSKIVFLENLTDLYEKMEDHTNAYLYSKKLKQVQDSLNDAAQDIAIQEYRTKYQTAEKEKQLLISDQKKKQNQNIAIALGGGVIGVSLIGFLLFKNTKRKQRMAEQEREIEIQKTEKILKEQELTTIDAMIFGQEKERERLAGDLHDSVGATLAAAKLQFNHLKGNEKSENLDDLYTSTGELLEQAYQEIRTMAHLKNSGVIAKNGLLPAIEKLAKNASATSSLTIEVQDFGLDERLENSLEISIFRIIQELVTNIIKHSKASEATISITNHDASLNIIVEDNGQGFNSNTLLKKEGMGLSSIERRVEHLEGTMEVDSTKGQGTTILIDIPI